jgi:hypothetical protein
MKTQRDDNAEIKGFVVELDEAGYWVTAYVEQLGFGPYETKHAAELMAQVLNDSIERES